MMATPPSELAPWWSKPEWITGIGTVALVVVTAALVVVPLATWLIDRYLKRRERFLRICRADRFDPEEIVVHREQEVSASTADLTGRRDLARST